MKIDIISREIIKPSSPTPHHLQTFNLSFFDQHNPDYHSTFTLFYVPTNRDHNTAAERSRRLKESLSEVLTRFYPLAGRIKDHMSVDCNDQGAEFLEARVNCTIKDILQQPDVKACRRFTPQVEGNGTPLQLNRIPLLLIQATTFKCGGMALASSIFHMVADAAACGTFLKAWASACATATSSLGGGDVPELTAASSLFPPLSVPKNISEIYVNSDMASVDGIPRRYVFDSSSIAALRVKAASGSVPVPTRYESVSALMWKCLMAISKDPRPALHWTINFRSFLDPPLPLHSFGNVILYRQIISSEKQKLNYDDIELSVLVELMRASMTDFRENFVHKLVGENGADVYLKGYDEVMRRVIKGDARFHSSLCGFPFYETDFGWEKPAWAAFVPLACHPEILVFQDTRDGEGIEVHMNFATEDQVALFESNKDLTALAAVNPSPLVNASLNRSAL